jgi:hypothetical protein
MTIEQHQTYFEEVKKLVYDQINYLKGFRGNSFYDQNSKPSLKPNIEPDDEELAELAYISLGLGEQRFLPSRRYGSRL